MERAMGGGEGGAWGRRRAVLEVSWEDFRGWWGEGIARRL